MQLAMEETEDREGRDERAVRQLLKHDVNSLAVTDTDAPTPSSHKDHSMPEPVNNATDIGSMPFSESVQPTTPWPDLLRHVVTSRKSRTK